ncbi:hypothetical protein [Leptospira weilii]|uniref:Uncharacterized protein n=1 Tax=Leptospira weilii str. UI 13098 TaxID=1088542 RepID=M6QJ81_9LEPT|nr:hypothetical protein [Leptospira weilii]EMN92558.1 hypothetical protein LEP1GSC108_0429 [Leptospira weilii str. UI 13098]OMI14673.1 hypothetical protein BUQ74_20635 [Leptospira weilii serovar Heyan]
MAFENTGIIQSLRDDVIQEFGLFQNPTSKEIHFVRMSKDTYGEYYPSDFCSVCERIYFDSSVNLLSRDFERGKLAFVEAYLSFGRGLCSWCGARFLASIQ